MTMAAAGASSPAPSARPSETGRQAQLVALVGPPNSGKTALFNALTGGRQKVANYPGVTVERKEGVLGLPDGRRLSLLDLPGTYSLRARSPDEAITRDAVRGRRDAADTPDAILGVADATDLRTAIRLMLELKQVGRPMLLAVNMFDIARHRGLDIDLERLSVLLGMPVVSSVAVRRGGTAALVDHLGRLPPSAPGATDRWREPGTADLRVLNRRADEILAACIRQRDQRPDWTRRIDNVLLHPVGGLAVLAGVLFLMFQAVFAWATPAMDLIEAGIGLLGAGIGDVLPDGWLRGLLVDGVIAGVGSVLVFLPQIVLLFLFIQLLEDSGYMARAAFLMDRIMGGAGLHGRAFIPLLSSFACAIPGIMGTRVIENRRDRLTTILVAPLMTCSARIPVYALIIGAFVPDRRLPGGINLQGLVMFALYGIGITSALLVALFAKWLGGRHRTEPFLLMLPGYKLPRIRNIAIGLRQRAWMFLRRAGTIILALMILIWVLSSFPAPPENAVGPAVNHSIAGLVGHAIQPIFAPIGFNWQIVVALLTGLAAREVAVAALGTIYAVGDAGDAALSATLGGAWTLPTALAFLAWYVFAPQCAATLAVIRRETHSRIWPALTFAYMFALAYLAAFVTYRAASFAFG